MLWSLKRTSSRTLPFRKQKRRRYSKNPTLIALAIEQIKANASTQRPVTLFSLPPEIRNRIYSYVFDDDDEIILVNIYDDVQSWVRLPDAPRNELKFFPRRLAQIPEPLKAEALAFAFQNTTFVVSSMQDILTLYSLIGEIGLKHLNSLVIEWWATADVDRPLADEDDIAMQAFEVLSFFRALKKLTLVFNGFAFTLAYARYKHRRVYHDASTGIKGVQAPVRGPDFSGHTVKRCNIPPHLDGPVGSVIQIQDGTEAMDLWKVDRWDAYAMPLRAEIAQCDPLLVALRNSVKGLENLELRSPSAWGDTFADDVLDWLMEKMCKNDSIENQVEKYVPVGVQFRFNFDYDDSEELDPRL